jgi:hypothetical protein
MKNPAFPVALLVLAAAALGAQATNPAPPQRIPIPTRTYVALNPAGVVADVGTVEIESAIAQGVTMGGVASYIDIDHRRSTTAEFKIRYYPREIVLRGFAIGGTVGYTRFSNIVKDVRQEMSAPTLGIVLDHNWVYGREGHFVVGTGVGAKRVLAPSADRDRADVDRAVVTGRLVLGFAF